MTALIIVAGLLGAFAGVSYFLVIRRKTDRYLARLKDELSRLEELTKN